MNTQPQVIAITSDQLKDFAGEVAAKLMAAKTETSQHENERRFVYGLRGIRELFNVSHVTAQKYKNTFLAPAVMQRGRKIVVDVAKALDLYNQIQQ